MKYIRSCLFLVLLFAGCTFNQYQSDVADNQYYEKQKHKDPSAAYVGEWNAPFNGGMRSIKINEDGRIKVCLSPSSGITDGKVYLDNGTPGFMLKTGAIAKIISINKDSLLLEIYGKREKYYVGLVPDACTSAFINFK
jgi:hypothetical protein